MHPAALEPIELLKHCDITRTRRGGPGGQHRNKVETAVVITHRPTGLTGQASERRSQDLNRQAAVQRLRITLALSVRTAVGPDDPLSDLWQSRVRGRQLSVSAEHEDFPALLAEALDRLAACDWEAAIAAGQLGLTTTQLVKFLKLESAAMQQLNQARVKAGLKLLK
ncbi:MAG: peptide chain release factor-like protein [Pirellulaceae bacterium]|nr:peptide chain release factor-like protein [Pirellulaceae bacterium]